MSRRFEVNPDMSGQRLDQILRDTFPGLSRTVLQRLIEDGLVTVCGRASKPSDRPKLGEFVDVELRLPPSLSASPEDIELNVVYEDGAMAIVDKPAGMVVHPAPGHVGGTLVNALTHRYPHLNETTEIRPGIVHRLDRDTSGLLVVALTTAAQHALANQLRRREMKREYVALVSGHPSPRPHLIDAPIGRDPRSRAKMAVGDHSIRPRAARTRFSVIEEFAEFALLRVGLETGRTHQIRVHLSYCGYPVAGDVMYGGAKALGLHRQFLHAAVLELVSPLSGKVLRFTSDLPSDLEAVLQSLRLSKENVAPSPT